MDNTPTPNDAPMPEASLLEPQPTTAPSRSTRWLVVTFYLLCVIWGVRCVWYTQESPLDFYLPISLWIISGWWVVTDARQRRHPIPLHSQMWFYFLAPLAVPGYILWSRGWRGLGWLVLHLVLGFLLATLALHVGGYVVYGEAWLRGLGLIS